MTPLSPRLSSVLSVPLWHIILLFALAATLFLPGRSITTGLPLYFSTFAILALICPPSTLSQSTLSRQALCAAAPVDALALLLLPALFTAQITLVQWLLFYTLLISFAAALWGCARLLNALTLPTPLSSALTTLIFFAWLTWPLWTSAFFSSPAAAHWLTPPHPLFAANTLLHPPFGVWTEHPFAYRLTTLNQDLPYTLPSSILPSLLAHTTFAAFTLTAARLLHPRHFPSAPPPENQ